MVIEAMPEVIQEFPAARLEIIGTGPYEGRLKGLARELGVENSVDFRGLMGHRELFANLSRGGIALAPYVDDPDSMGRIKARVPSVCGTEETGWALPCLPFVGPDMGIFMVPEVDANVWVEFEQGDIRFPIWSGGWWSTGSDVPNGATPQQVLLAATKNAAELCGVGDDLGTIEVGKLADMIAVAENPLEDVANVRKLRLVFKEGRVVSDKRRS